MLSFDVILPLSVFWRMVHILPSKVLQAFLSLALGHLTLGFWLCLVWGPLAGLGCGSAEGCPVAVEFAGKADVVLPIQQQSWDH